MSLHRVSDYKRQAAHVDEAARRDAGPLRIREVIERVGDSVVVGETRNESMWRNSLGEPVDLDNIDSEYALNIYTMAVKRRGANAVSETEMRADPLLQKLREVILAGKKPGPEDHRRAMVYNALNAARGLRWRA